MKAEMRVLQPQPRNAWRRWTGQRGILQCVSGCRAAPCLTFISDNCFWSCDRITFLLFHTMVFMVICYNNSRKVIQVLKENKMGWWKPDARSHIVKTMFFGTSLVVQRLRICLPMQGMGFQSLMGELRLDMSISSPIAMKSLLAANRILPATTNTWCSQINNKKIFETSNDGLLGSDHKSYFSRILLT